MTMLLMIAGSWHGSWCWDPIRSQLEDAGRVVLTPNLQGVGGMVDAANGVTMATWVDQIGALVSAQPEPVVLVGHSRGGAVISQVAERMAHRISKLIYVCAFLLRDGETIADTQRRYNSITDIGSALIPGLYGTTTVDVARARSLFYSATPLDLADAAVSRIGVEPMAPSATPLALSEGRYGAIRRAYIECTLDKAIPLALQREMQEALPCDEVITLKADHSPFYSAAGPLADALIGLSG